MENNITPEQRVWFYNNKLDIVGNGINVLEPDIQELKGDFVISAKALAEIIPMIHPDKMGRFSYYRGNVEDVYVGSADRITEEMTETMDEMKDLANEYREKYYVTLTELKSIKESLDKLPALKKKLIGLDKILEKGTEEANNEREHWK